MIQKWRLRACNLNSSVYETIYRVFSHQNTSESRYVHLDVTSPPGGWESSRLTVGPLLKVLTWEKPKDAVQGKQTIGSQTSDVIPTFLLLLLLVC